MKTRLLKYWDEVQSSYWFIPTLMALGAIGLAFAMTRLDNQFGSDWMEGISWFYANKPAGARAVLSTIAGSMIGVAGVTFSITIVSVSFASGQFGPRILTNFMRDTGNQVTLGTFIATFLYCLLILRTVRSAEETPADAAQAAELTSAFVPHLAILVALALAIASLGVLIYFIHHIPESIHISNVIAAIGRELNRSLDTVFPERIGQESPSADAPPPAQPDEPEGDPAPVRADGYGYLQHRNDALLLQVAQANDLVLRLRYRMGDFVRPGTPLIWAWPAARLDDEAQRQLQTAFVWGNRRTTVQDTRFLADELVEIAARALSPGVNDPFTAMGCLDWLGGALAKIARRKTPDACRYDDDGTLRVIAEPTTFETFADLIFGQLRPYVRTDRNAALHMLAIMADVGTATTDETQRDVLRRHAADLLEGCNATLAQETDRAEVHRQYQATLRALHPDAPPTPATLSLNL